MSAAITRRWGTAPAQRCNQAANCPDVFELDTGDFAIIGEDITTLFEGAQEKCVAQVPREVLMAAVKHYLEKEQS